MDTEDSKILSQAPNCPMEKEQKDEGYFDKTQTLKDAGMIEFSVPCHRPSSSEQRKEEEPHELLVPDLCSLPLTPPTAVDCNFTCYFAPDFMKPDHDQYVYRHPNGLCVIGLASTHVALKDREGYIAIIMPTPTDWIKAKNQLLSLEEFKKLRGLC
ncbi:uncharacterized protein LOC113323385 isoform X2 [Papaver somniferum]|uniref:uncharacterized protein LOC113323385 isoform X2 n=1 Tax=Papaver somniferum TaxID=3469 RepID=UPI000E70492C|nr:uncharacterized protein LOC113323385 isoform X2 [Papaver somniferum]